MIVHATAVARRAGGDWRGVLLFGPSGSGKSDLALRALQAGWRLVADDYSHVWRSGGRLWACAPGAIAGLIEARGVGIVPAPRRDLAAIDLAVDCGEGPVERLPDPARMRLEGVAIPRLVLAALEPSALAKLDRAVSTQAGALGAGTGSV